MATLTLTDIKKSYPNGFQAIHGVDLAIDDGEMVVLVGPSGCGKSTLLRMIAGLEEISAGQLTINEQPVNDLEPGQRDIAMVFQNYALYPHMSVFDNMAYGLKNRKVPKEKIREMVTDTATMLELDHLLERKPKQLSGGQRQRVAMGRAIVRSPKVFLFDEPLSNLDAKLRVQMRLEIKKLQRRLQTTAVYVTHDQVEAMTLGDKLVVLNQGNIEQVGTPMAIYQQPASLFVATFIGAPAMNILDCLITADGLELGRYSLKMDTTWWALGQVKLGMRPEHIQIVENHPMFEATIEMIEALGADVLLYCHIRDNEAQKLIIRVHEGQRFDIGETLGLAISLEHLHLFDATSEQRLPSPLSVTVQSEIING
ncbi:sn-glycerol-3-phosphate import ATP-binding protein UgpC [Vibrio gazogenes]|uniref:sn-glycerol 3-phosphate transport system ATP-binding protein n=1 Tax=Vibrio gazogenes DSM 21264 = NBRC 103151 TaxID=1123492 RepID=A0A1M4V5A7_VIBGA|nr:sn-glycerol-3-phosphate import ATP-binding protein UgpC [Vibrio gazogenes]USP15614.1 sn-glycerol-3-phosphate import ATP-binding protein UgpC [Vibrio gazogenes]SHE64048.1 sn-glycerol 3-phosphate transport system ATP-binding protein [Vibrio gazogenes DSM 21264] [Vibrio gazogenes DSM 21264 = NBRC 103151]SJN54634.1 sn-glycerol-3-phosphate import ATP-binding protein UgpC [Vibrio gazogenes]